MTEADYREITDVIIRYGSGIDRRDWTLFKSCFIEELQADYGDFGVWTHVDRITEFMRHAHQDMSYTLHRMSNIAIAPNHDGARARTYVDALLTYPDPDKAPNNGIGFYDDEFVKTADGWKIASRAFTLVLLR